MNNEFSKELAKQKNKMAMSAAARSFSSCLAPDELEQCKLLGLWKTVNNFDRKFGNRFTSLLYTNVRFECINQIKRNKPRAQSLFDESIEEPVKEYHFHELVDGLSDTNKELLYQKYIQCYTLQEMAHRNKCSISCVRRKVKAAEKRMYNIWTLN